MNKQKFFAALRGTSLYLQLPQTAVDSLNLMIAHGSHLPVDHLAYVMATAYHEVGRALIPKTENLNYSTAEQIKKTWPSRFKTLDFAKQYVKQPKKLAMYVYGNRADLGNVSAEDGWLFRGRGFPQTTGRANYKKARQFLGIDFISNPDLMNDPVNAVKVMIAFMERGTFTGVKLSDFTEFKSMRRIINADVEKNGAKIASYAILFRNALIAGGYNKGENVPLPIEDKPVINIEPAAKHDNEQEEKPVNKTNPYPAIVSLILAALFGVWGWLINLPCNILGIFCGG